MNQRVNEDRLSAFFSTLSDELNASLSVHEGSKLRLVQRMRKRAGFVNSDLEPKAIDKFLNTNSSIKDYCCTLSPDIEANARHFITVMLERYYSYQSDLNIQVVLDLNTIYDHWRFGPGASNGVKGTHTAEKIEVPMTCTALCEPYVRRLRALNTYLHAIDGKRGESGVTLIYGSRLTTVPKNEDTVRTIAIEPSGNMAMQLAAGHVLEEVLRQIGCDISRQQPLNKALAKAGSIDGSLCTIDLSSASDMISIDLVRRLLPPKWFKLLMEIRSPTMQVRGEQVELNMISTMGNGFTFPLMTLIIISLIYGFRCTNGGPTLYMDWTQTAVFGDDIIVTSAEYEGLCKVLADAGLVVNHDKSYSNGPFRESCGGDYLEGYDVTPFYVRNLRYDSEIYVAINQLLEWSGRNNFFPTTSYQLLVKMLHRGPFFVPEWLNPDQGIKTSQVDHKYSRLELKQVETPYTGFFALPLACGGYLSDNGSGPFYVRRTSRPVYRTRGARLPRGYLDGSDPLSRSAALTSRIATIVALAS